MKLLLFCMFALYTLQAASQPSVKKALIVKANGSFQLLVNGQPYFIKGAVGHHYLLRLKTYGGNSIRTNSNPAILDSASKYEITALVNLPVKAQRDGMNYDDSAAVRLQHEKVIEIVRRLKDHPAVIMWALGNELDFIQANINERYNIKVWNAVEKLAKEIHELDPLHPVMTVVGSITEDKIDDLVKHCPSIDLLGINEYGDLLKIPLWLRNFGWQKPYVVTEWGPTGFWQVPKTAWKAPIEETSSMKAAKYKERYEQTIAGDTSWCLGSYVFLWRQHQERTHTWFGMFDENGLETEAVDVMQHAWTGHWPDNRTPQLDSMKIDGRTAYQDVYLKPLDTYEAQVWVRDPDRDEVKYRWEILREGTAFPYGGNGERKPESISTKFSNAQSSRIRFTSPTTEGAYRLFVYAYDGHGNWATANVPFYVK